MKQSGRFVLGVGTVLLSLPGCSKTEASSVDGGTDAAPAAAVVPPPSGRCKITSADSAYDTLFFFPEKHELLAHIEGGVSLEPLTVTSSTMGRVEFWTKPWRDPDKEDAPTTQTGTLTFTGAKWSFSFERHKDADCSRDTFDLTYKSLPEIGIKAGTWASKEGLSMTFLADGQRFLQKYKKEEKVIHYRVVDKTEAGIVIGTSATPPSSSGGDIWLTSTLTPVGDKLQVSMKDLQLMLSFAGPVPVGSASASAGASEPAPPTAKAVAPRVVTVSPAAKACCDAVAALATERGTGRVKIAADLCRLNAEQGRPEATKPMLQRQLLCDARETSCTPVPIPTACN